MQYSAAFVGANELENMNVEMVTVPAATSTIGYANADEASKSKYGGSFVGLNELEKINS